VTPAGGGAHTSWYRGDTQTELPSAKKVAKVMGLNKHKTGKGKVKQPRRPSLTGPNTSIQKWGTVYDPTLSWGKMPMVSPRPPLPALALAPPGLLVLRVWWVLRGRAACGGSGAQSDVDPGPWE
jgi:hypothetical protein